MRKLILILLLFPIYLFAQIDVGTGINTTSKELSDFKGKRTYYAQLSSILADTGQITYVIDSAKYFSFNGTSWAALTTGGSADAAPSDTTYYSKSGSDWVNVDSNNVTRFQSTTKDLYNWRYKLSSGKYSPSTNFTIGVIGDSYGPHYVKGFQTFGYNKHGFGGFYKSTDITNYEIRYHGIYLNWGSGWVGNGGVSYDKYCHGLHYITASSTDSTALSAKQFNKFRIRYRHISGGGTFTVGLNYDGARVSISTDSTNTGCTWYTKDWTNSVRYDEYDTVWVKVVSGSVRVYGVGLWYDPVQPTYGLKKYGLEICDISSGGSTIDQHYLNKDATSLNAAFDTLGIDLMLMVTSDNEDNDILYARSDTLIDTLRVFDDEMDILVIRQNDNGAGFAGIQNNMWYQLAKDNDVAFIDIGNQMGEFDKLYDVGLIDSIHPLAAGDIAIYQVLEPYLFFNDSYTANGVGQDLTLYGNHITFPDAKSFFFSTTGGLKEISNNRYNIGIGYKAGDEITSGQKNIIMSSGGDYDLTEGSYNLFFGGGENVTTGGRNILIGTNAGNAHTTSSWNIAIGVEALKVNTSTSLPNIAIGSESLEALVTGIGNTAIGTKSLWKQTGNYSTVIGHWAGYGTSGTGNTFLGYQSSTATHSANYDTFVGNQSGYSKSGGGYNAFVGNKAGYNSASGAYCVFIGNEAGYNETTSNKLYIENSNSATPLIYGEFDNDIVKINGGLEVTSDVTIENGVMNGREYSDSLDYLIHPSHWVLKFEDSTATVALTSGTWTQMTNTYDSIWQQVDVGVDYFTLSNDTLYNLIAGHYIFQLNIGIDVGSNNNGAIRVNTDGGVCATMVGGSGVNGQYNGIPCSGYAILSENEKLWFEIQNMTDNDDFDLISGNFVIWYLHP